MSTPRRCFALVIVCLLAVDALAQEWPRFRGPGGGGLADGKVPATADANSILWRTALPGVGHASAVAWGERVFTTCADEQTGTKTLVCLGVRDGAVLWKHDWTYENYRHHGENSYASSTPAVDAERVYVCLLHPSGLKVAAFDHDGAEAWTSTIGPWVTDHGGGQSLIVHGGLVIVPNEQDGPGSSLLALDKHTGAVKWTVPRRSKRFSASTPCVFRPGGAGGGEQLVFTSWANGVTAVNPADGTVLWELPDVFDARTVASPVAANEAGLVLASCGEGPGGHWLVAVRPPKQPGGKPKVAYKITKAAPYVPTPLVKGHRLYYWADNGTVTCAEVATGRTVWQERVPGGTYFGSPVCAGDTLFAVSKRGNLVALANADQFKLLGNSDLGDKSDATPCISRGRMYVRTYGQLICVGEKQSIK